MHISPRQTPSNPNASLSFPSSDNQISLNIKKKKRGFLIATATCCGIPTSITLHPHRIRQHLLPVQSPRSQRGGSAGLQASRRLPTSILVFVSQRHAIREAVLALAQPRLDSRVFSAIMDPSPDPIADLITTYKELNSSFIEELKEEPSPLEFMRYVARNTPFVVRKAAANWTATKTWTASFLEHSLQDHQIKVAVTPRG